MFEIKQIDNTTIKEFFLSDPSLAYLGLSDEILMQLYNDEYSPLAISTHMGVYKDNELVFIFKYEHFTTVCMNIHCYLHSQYHHTGTFRQLRDFLVEWTKETYPHIVKVLSMVPSSCTHIPPVNEAMGFKKEGHLEKAMIWRQELVDVLIFGLEI